MNKKFISGVFAGSLTIVASLALAPPAMADGEWKAPDVTIFLGSDALDSGQTDKPGPSLNETISNYWDDGVCTYDAVTGEPNSDCDRLRFGLAMYRGADDPANAGYCPDSFASLVQPKEDGGGELTLDGFPYKIAQLQSKAGSAYCSDFDQRTHGESLLDYRDHRFGEELDTNWPDRPQLILTLIKQLPQSDSGAADHVRDSLLATDELYKGNGGQHLSLPTWVLLSPEATDDGKLYGELLAAAGGTGKCCYKPYHGGSCDPNAPLDPNDPNGPTQAIDVGDHLNELDGAGALIHNEVKLRADIALDLYECTGTGKPAGPGGMHNDKFSDMKCHLQGSPCDGGTAPTDPAYLWPIFSCIQLRPANIPADQLSVEYCGDIDPTQDKDGDGCLTLTPGDGIEWVDDDKNLFYFSDGDESMCTSIGSGDSWSNVNCPNLNKLCDLEDSSQCSLGRVQCVNNEEVCQRYPGNDSCDSAACGSESVHQTGIVHPNVQFAVDRSGSMWGDRWSSATEVAENLADWSFEGAGCEPDGTNCDKLRMGVHFWDDEPWAVHSAQEDLTEDMMEDAFDGYGPRGGTDFHHAANLIADEAALQDPNNPNAAIFFTDGVPESAFTTREAVRTFCDLKSRPGTPVATHSVGYQDGNQLINSAIAAAGGTGSCCFAEDGTCDSERETSPCELYQYEIDHGQSIVDSFEAWLSANDSSAYNEWNELTDDIASAGRTASPYRTGSVADDLGMVDDIAQFLYERAGGDVDNIDCAVDAGDPNAGGGNPQAFYRHMICEMQNTLSYVIRHKYGGKEAKDVDSWSEFDRVYTTNHDSTFADNDYVCTGAKFANDEDALYAELQAILMGMECTYPLSLLSDMDSAPEFTDATMVKLYMPEFDTVVSVPHSSDTAALAAFEAELCSLGVENCTSYADDGWSFANEGRTAVSLSSELCDFTKSDSVEKVTTQVCRMCNPALVGTSCDYVACEPDNPPSNPSVDDIAYTSGGEMCEYSEFPCPENPNQTCSQWSKTGRCGAGAYACDDDGFPYCEQTRSQLPEICNGVDDDCDGSIDDLIENKEQWSDPAYDITGEPYDGWYCGYHDTCSCPGLTPDSLGGTKADGELEFQRMLEHQEANGECVCGEGIAEDGMPAYESTRTFAPTNPQTEEQASCSASGKSSAPGGLAAVLAGLLLGALGWRRRS
jgi:uncharacterized protein (TIGR03382 family)